MMYTKKKKNLKIVYAFQQILKYLDVEFFLWSIIYAYKRLQNVISSNPKKRLKFSFNKMI